jgi:hypothetical protein
VTGGEAGGSVVGGVTVEACATTALAAGAEGVECGAAFASAVAAAGECALALDAVGDVACDVACDDAGAESFAAATAFTARFGVGAVAGFCCGAARDALFAVSLLGACSACTATLPTGATSEAFGAEGAGLRRPAALSAAIRSAAGFVRKYPAA